jgi:hypothetical protein
VDRPDAVALYAELLRLTEEMHAAARIQDDATVADLAGRREVVVAAIAEAPVGPEAAAGVADVIRRVITLDGEVLGALRGRSEATRHALETIAARRRSLQSYRGAAPTDPLFIERIG